MMVGVWEGRWVGVLGRFWWGRIRGVVGCVKVGEYFFEMGVRLLNWGGERFGDL